jgi:hypothetical protein
MTRDAHYAEADRLWQAIKRDYFREVEVFAGAREVDAGREKRFLKNWDALCTLDLDIASTVWHGLKEVEVMFGRMGEPNSPADHNLRQLGEFVEVLSKGREANPDAVVKTAGELYALGEEAIRREVENDFGTGAGQG